MTTEDLFLTLHWRGWTFESNGRGVMYIWKAKDPLNHLAISAANDIIVCADLTEDVIDALTLLRAWNVNVMAKASA